MQFAIDPKSDTPIYLQLKDQIRYAVSVGELRPGDRLPSIRRLEADLGLNRNTVRRAYLELEAEGTLVLRQGRLAEVAPRAVGRKAKARPSEVSTLAQKSIREVEAKGIDCVRFAAAIRRAADEHDARYPKCVFLECSQDQASDFAAATEAAWQRRVVGVDIQRLRESGDGVPPATKYVLTTHWHMAEAKRLLRRHNVLILEVGVRPSKSFEEGIRRLAGLKTGLLLRDSESVAGYRQFVAKHVRVKGSVRVALLDEEGRARDLLQAVEGLVYTAPCRGFVGRHAPADLIQQELLLELTPDDLYRRNEEILVR